MTQAVAKAVTIILLAAPGKQGEDLTKAFMSAGVECIQADTANSCLELVKSVLPSVILIDLDLTQEGCRQIITGLGETVEGRTIPIVLLARITDLDILKSEFLSVARDIIFKPLHIDEVITRMELIREKSRNGVTGGLQKTDRNIISAARKACHELNQPLQYIMGSVQLALLDISAEDPMYEMVNGLRQQSERMAQIAAELMQLIRSMG